MEDDETNKEVGHSPTKENFGNTELGQMLGCGWIILCILLGVAAILWVDRK